MLNTVKSRISSGKHFKTLFLIQAMILLLISSVSLAQESHESKESKEVPGDWGIRNSERQESVLQRNDVNIPQELINQYLDAKNSSNENEKLRIGNLIQSYIEQNSPSKQNQPSLESEFKAEFSTNFNNPPFQTDWYTSDVQPYSGTLGTNGGFFRRLDLKQGDDNWMYLCIARTGISGTLDGITVYMSSNNGATWPMSQTLSFASWKLFTLSMLVENRSVNNSNPDSTRFLVYFTTAPNVNGNDAQLWVWSSRRNGTAQFNQVVGTPPAGNKYEYVSACSDGQYYDVPTFMHAVVKEATNTNTHVGLRHYFTTNWASTHSNSAIVTGNNDFYPSVQYGEKNGSDSIYIAIERRFSATDYEIRVLATPEFPSTTYHPYYITNTSGIKYEKPCLTVVQQHGTVQKKMIVTCTKANVAKYHYSLNGGTTWTIDQNLTSVGLRDFTWCSSDSNTTGGGYVMMCTVDQNGDSVTIRRGTPTSMGTYQYKRNSVMSTGLLAPVCAIINTNGILNSALTYAGQGPNNVYYNAEQLITAVEPIGNNVPDRFELSQNYPNPFNPVTNINFSIPKSGMVKLVVYDMLGKQISELVNGNYNAGSYKVDFNASTLSSGVYFYKIEAEGFTDVKKMMLVK